MKTLHHRLWKTRFIGLFGVLGILTWGAWEVLSQQPRDMAQLIQVALQDDSRASTQAIEGLRKLGPHALNYLMFQPELRKSPRWAEVLDAVAQQRDAKYCGLFWYTDLEQAKEVAEREHKPILSLRLLGKLTDELSCANSRFFRTTLYPQQAVRDLLSEKFVLHWESVRAVPIITIDFGEGRMIKRTITGNSAHLVLDSRGRPIDVLPGLYGAGAFVRELTACAPAAVQLALLEGTEFQQQRTAFHQGRLRSLQEQWHTDCTKANVSPTRGAGVDQDAAVWTKLAALYFAESVPMDAAQAAVESKTPPVQVANNAPRAEAGIFRTMAKGVVETPMARQIRNIGNSISEDTVRNQYHLHYRIHLWFTQPQPLLDSDKLLLTQVYSDLFLSPLNDPWYGLSRPDVYSAITQDGRIDAVTQNTHR